MPASRAATNTTDPADSWRVHKTFYLLVFAAAALLAYQWGRQKAYRGEPAEDSSATAVVRRQVAPAGSESPVPGRPDPQAIRRQIVSEESLTRAARRAALCFVSGDDRDAQRTIAAAQRRVRVETTPSTRPDEVQISITCAQRRGQQAVQLANALAEQYAADCRAEWKSAAGQAYQAARGAAEQAEGALRDAQAKLAAFVERSLAQEPPREKPAAPPPSTPKMPPQPLAIEPPTDNPEWRQLHRRIEDLERHRDDLLVERTPAHPAVQEAESRILDLKRQLATKTRWLGPPPGEEIGTNPAPAQPRPETVPADDTPSARQPAEQQAQTAQEFRTLKDAVERATQARDSAAAAERRAWQACLQEPRIEVDLAQAAESPAPAGPGMGLLMAAMMAGLSAVFGVGLISAGAAMDRPVRSIGEVEALLPAPVVAVVPVDESDAGGPALLRWRWLARPLVIAGGVLAVLACVCTLWIVK